jgi:hypothetical protein
VESLLDEDEVGRERTDVVGVRRREGERNDGRRRGGPGRCEHARRFVMLTLAG